MVTISNCKVNEKWAIPEKKFTPYVEEVRFSVQGEGTPKKPKKIQGCLEILIKIQDGLLKKCNNPRGYLTNRPKNPGGSLKNEIKIQGGL